MQTSSKLFSLCDLQNKNKRKNCVYKKFDKNKILFDIHMNLLVTIVVTVCTGIATRAPRFQAHITHSTTKSVTRKFRCT